MGVTSTDELSSVRCEVTPVTMIVSRVVSEPSAAAGAGSAAWAVAAETDRIAKILRRNVSVVFIHQSPASHFLRVRASKTGMTLYVGIHPIHGTEKVGWFVGVRGP